MNQLKKKKEKKKKKKKKTPGENVRKNTGGNGGQNWPNQDDAGVCYFPPAHTQMEIIKKRVAQDGRRDA